MMTPLGPFGVARRVVIGVSGGADSMALALLLRDWGRPAAVVVDHGLRSDSAAEAALTVKRLTSMGVAARCETLSGLGLGANLGARARDARYAALFRICRSEGLPDLLVAHHAQDQVETVLLRQARGSGPAGLAAMPAIGWRADARILRPLLSVPPARLRATLIRAGVDWVEDPSNRDRSTARGGLRFHHIDIERGLRAAMLAGEARAMDETAQAIELGQAVMIAPTGQGVVAAPLRDRAWSALIWTISGRAYPPSPNSARCLGAIGTGTLHSIQVRNGLVMRESGPNAYSTAAVAGTLWDGRFFIRRTVPNGQVTAWSNHASGPSRDRTIPFSVKKTLPVLRLGTDLFTSPDLVYLAKKVCANFQVEFRPARPLAGAPFIPGR